MYHVLYQQYKIFTHVDYLVSCIPCIIYNDDLTAVHACCQLSKYKWLVQHVLLWQLACWQLAVGASQGYKSLTNF